MSLFSWADSAFGAGMQTSTLVNDFDLGSAASDASLVFEAAAPLSSDELALGGMRHGFRCWNGSVVDPVSLRS